MTQAYPLQWPHTRKRRDPAQRSYGAFGTMKSRGNWQSKERVTVAEALGRLQDELDRIGAKSYVLSTNLETRLDGLPRSGQREPADPGVALYFELNGEPHCLPCDTYLSVAQNIAAIAKHIEATRAIERYGVASLKEMFTGFAALPAPDQATKRTWRQVLGLAGAHMVDKAMIETAYRQLAKKSHPDHGGSDAAMAELNTAKVDALREIGA